jgi:hypothetical protein
MSKQWTKITLNQDERVILAINEATWKALQSALSDQAAVQALFVSDKNFPGLDQEHKDMVKDIICNQDIILTLEIFQTDLNTLVAFKQACQNITPILLSDIRNLETEQARLRLEQLVPIFAGGQKFGQEGESAEAKTKNVITGLGIPSKPQRIPLTIVTQLDLPKSELDKHGITTSGNVLSAAKYHNQYMRLSNAPHIAELPESPSSTYSESNEEPNSQVPRFGLYAMPYQAIVKAEAISVYGCAE